MGLPFEPQCRASEPRGLTGGLGWLAFQPLSRVPCGLNWGLSGLAFQPQCMASGASWLEMGVGWAQCRASDVSWPELGIG